MYIVVISALSRDRLKKEDFYDSKASLGYIMRTRQAKVRPKDPVSNKQAPYNFETTKENYPFTGSYKEVSREGVNFTPPDADTFIITVQYQTQEANVDSPQSLLISSTFTRVSQKIC